MAESSQDLIAQLQKERAAMLETIKDAHAVAQELKAAVKEAREEIRGLAKDEARKHLARQFQQASEQLRKTL
jgi:F0F1-type ATP synthase membrane subunit b/b'